MKARANVPKLYTVLYTYFADMIVDNEPWVSKLMNHSKGFGGVNFNSVIAGVIEACLDAMGFPCHVSAHSQPSSDFYSRAVFLIKLEDIAMDTVHPPLD